MGTKFTVYDNGVNPQKASASTLETGTLRQELAAVCYVGRGPWVSGLQARQNTQDFLPVCGLFHLLLRAEKEGSGVAPAWDRTQLTTCQASSGN